MNDYVTKPIDPDTLYQALARAVAALVEREPTASSAASQASTVSKPEVTELADPLSPVAWEEVRGRCLNNDQLLERVVKAFTERAPGMIDELRTASETAQWPTLKKLAHALKGMSGNVGANEVMAAALALEDQLEQPTRDDIAACLLAIEFTLDRALLEMHNFLRAPAHEAKV